MTKKHSRERETSTVGESKLAALLKSLQKSWVAIIGLVTVLLISVTALLAPLLATHDPEEMDFGAFLAKPSRMHFLGTDNFGRDIFSRIVYGSRISIEVGLISVLIGTTLGVPIGLVSGFLGRRVDNILMRFMDSVLAFPELLLAITLVAIMGPGTVSVMIAIGIVYMPIMARITRSRVLSEKEKDYVLSAIALGERPLRILFSEILPNCIQVVIIHGTVCFSVAILVEAALSFLGIGTPPPTPSWGRMLMESKGFLEEAPHLAVFPGIAISVAVLGFNMLGDGLREVLDPHIVRR